MSIVQFSKHGKGQIDKAAAFCTILNNAIPSENILFEDVLKRLDDGVKEIYPEVTKDSLKNCRGDWYEWLIAVGAWNYYVNHPRSYVVLPLPNVSQFDVMRLYTDNLYNFIEEFRRKISESASVELITSNPDFVIIDTTICGHPENFTQKLESLTPQLLEQLKEAYKFYIGGCNFNSIVGYLSVKTSLRPDRRLQMAHEGSLMKALYIHLQTRQWIIAPRGIGYYAASIKVSKTDKKALRTVATHSITTVHSLPQAAVDEAFTVNSMLEAGAMFQKILHSKEGS
jgi:hypothetical protein